MTPLWKVYAKHLGRNYTSAAMPDIEKRFLQVPRAFDLSGVSDMCEQVWRELFIADADDSKIFDLGERCAVPCEHFWLEFRDNAYLVEACNEQDSGVYAVSELLTEGGLRLVTVGRIDQAGELFQVGATEECPDDYVIEGLQACGRVLSAIAVLNSPRARQEPAAARKLLGNKFPRDANPELRATRIYIDVGGRSVSGETLARTQSPKAYHFVRSHVRRFDDGTSTVVRAHWRGDPAFGVRVGIYTVRKTDALETVH